MEVEPTALHASQAVTEPAILVVSRPSFDRLALGPFLDQAGLSWEPDDDNPAHLAVEAAGRTCYLSFGRGRKSNAEYLANLVRQGHESVLEHVSWSFLVYGISRSLSHELVRHRAGFSYSQLSQRYVDESSCRFVVPPAIADDPEALAVWQGAMASSLAAYRRLVELLSRRLGNRKAVREAARSVLPNATETAVYLTANARALRHFLALRGSLAADAEMRRFAVALLRVMKAEAPGLFVDLELARTEGGTEYIVKTSL